MLGPELNHVAFYCKYDEIGLGAEAKASHNLIFVKGHGAPRNAQDAGDFLRGLPFSYHSNYFALPCC